MLVTTPPRYRTSYLSPDDVPVGRNLQPRIHDPKSEERHVIRFDIGEASEYRRRGGTRNIGMTWADALYAVTENRSAKGIRARKCF